MDRKLLIYILTNPINFLICHLDITEVISYIFFMIGDLMNRYKNIVIT